MRVGLFGLHSASEQPEILLMFRNQVASELLMKNERIRQHWAFPAQRWGAGDKLPSLPRAVPLARPRTAPSSVMSFLVPAHI